MIIRMTELYYVVPVAPAASPVVLVSALTAVLSAPRSVAVGALSGAVGSAVHVAVAAAANPLAADPAPPGVLGSALLVHLVVAPVAVADFPGLRGSCLTRRLDYLVQGPWQTLDSVCR